MTRGRDWRRRLAAKHSANSGRRATIHQRVIRKESNLELIYCSVWRSLNWVPWWSMMIKNLPAEESHPCKSSKICWILEQEHPFPTKTVINVKLEYVSRTWKGSYLNSNCSEAGLESNQRWLWVAGREGRGRRRSGLLHGLVIITGEMSHWRLKQPRLHPSYPRNCGDRAKDTRAHFSFFLFAGGCQTTKLTYSSARRHESLWGLKIHLWWKNTVTVNIPGWFPVPSLEDGRAVEFSRSHRVAWVQEE